jgi:hypothetical protein
LSSQDRRWRRKRQRHELVIKPVAAPMSQPLPLVLVLPLVLTTAAVVGERLGW